MFYILNITNFKVFLIDIDCGWCGGVNNRKKIDEMLGLVER